MSQGVELARAAQRDQAVNTGADQILRPALRAWASRRPRARHRREHCGKYPAETLAHSFHCNSLSVCFSREYPPRCQRSRETAAGGRTRLSSRRGTPRPRRRCGLGRAPSRTSLQLRRVPIDVKSRSRLYVTSSQRHTNVSASGRFRNSLRRRKARSRAAAKRRPRTRSAKCRAASPLFPTADSPAIWPSMSASRTRQCPQSRPHNRFPEPWNADFINHDRRIANIATEQHRQLEIGHKAEAAGEDVARFGPSPPTALQRDGLDFRIRRRRGWPAAG